MNWRQALKKLATIIVVAFVGAGLMAACGKKEEPAKEEYVYNTTYERIKNDSEDMYTVTSDVNGNIILSVLCEYMSNSQKYYFKTYDIATKQSNLVSINDERLSESGYIQYCHLFNDGSFGAIVSVYDMTSMDNEYYYSIYSASGELKEDNKLKIEKNSDYYFYLGNVLFLEDKSIIVQSDSALYKIDESGKNNKTLTAPTWINNTMLTPDGKIYIDTYLDDKGESLCPVKADFSGLEDRLDISLNGASLYPSSEGKILVSSELTLREYDINTKTSETVWEWMDIDIEEGNIKSITANSDGTYRLITESWSEDFQGMEIATVEKKKAEPGTEKTKLVYGCYYMDYKVKQAIKDFNKSNNEYRISIKCYSDEVEDWETIVEKMGADITRGEIDIVDFTNLDYRKLASSKALACLDDYIKKDINTDNYFTNVFDAYKVNGKSYCIVPQVSISTLGISKEYTGGKGSVTIDELLEIRKKYPEKEMMSYASKEAMLYLCLMYTINDYVDFDKGTCSFETENFTKILEFANTFKNSDEIDYSDDYDEWGEMQKGNVIMTTLYLSSLDELQVYGKLMKGGLDITGYPTSKGSGNVLTARTQLGIAEKSKAKDGAWDFIKTFLSEDYQNKDRNYNGFPVLKSAFDDTMKEAMKAETYIDENGVEQEMSMGSWGNGYTTIEIYASSQEEVDLVRNIYENADTTAEYDEKLFELIDDEVQSYFAGQKSADEVASIIQGRVKIYLAESR